ncbi:MAG: ketoacyl-ACP synthase III [Anaerolineae bacterium]|nr:ketoacyl-ACP synthase III [Anaerolineae bacterium]
MPVTAHIVGWGSYLPEKVLTNAELESTLDTSDEWIAARTGIRERRVAAPGESTGTMAIEAARRALQVAAVEPSRVDLIIVATISPEYVFPATACLVQDAIGARNAAAFDISAGCTGFVYALAQAEQAIRAGNARLALVIGAEALSRFVDWEDRATCVLFGDGAGAVVLQAAENPGGILGTYLGSDGSGAELLYVPAGGARLPACENTVADRLHYLRMEGREVYRFAVKALERSTREVLRRVGLEVGDISLLIPHQANGRITDMAARALGLERHQVVETVEWCGNTSAASIPIALCRAIEDGRVHEGDLLVLVGFGAGLTWGAAAVRWSRIPTAPPGRGRIYYYRALYRLAEIRSLWRRLWRRLRSLALSWMNGYYRGGGGV